VKIGNDAAGMTEDRCIHDMPTAECGFCGPRIERDFVQ